MKLLLMFLGFACWTTTLVTLFNERWSLAILSFVCGFITFSVAGSQR